MIWSMPGRIAFTSFIEAKLCRMPSRNPAVTAPPSEPIPPTTTTTKLKTKKSKGSRFLVSEMTMNGWLKLENEPGWLAAHLRGVQDIGEVAAPLETEPMLELAVPASR